MDYLLFREGVEGPDVVLQVDGDEAEKTVERVWNYLLFRDDVEGPDVIFQGHGNEGKETVQSVELPSVQGQCRGV